mmetsp:Transcript_117646/g.186229  ORF Transcript_117646/g.186229 Transcript_117646/m.186229 type:complete len:364 (-) Transcript_117646:22-1113(-)
MRAKPDALSTLSRPLRKSGLRAHYNQAIKYASRSPGGKKRAMLIITLNANVPVKYFCSGLSEQKECTISVATSSAEVLMGFPGSPKKIFKISPSLPGNRFSLSTNALNHARSFNAGAKGLLTLFSHHFNCCSGNKADIGVSINPGFTMLTPNGSRFAYASRLSVSEKLLMKPLVALYTPPHGKQISAAMDATLQILGCLDFSSRGINNRVRRTGASQLTASMRLNCSSSTAAAGLICIIPATFARPDNPSTPISVATSSARRLTCSHDSGLLTSHTTVHTLPDVRSSNFFNCSSLKSTAITYHPSFSKRKTVARPIPDAAPVITAMRRSSAASGCTMRLHESSREAIHQAKPAAPNVDSAKVA